MTSSVDKSSDAGVVGAAVAAASRAAGGGRCAAVGIWVVWMRGPRVVRCESVPRLDYAVPANRPSGVDTVVVIAVAPSRLSDPVIGRARVIVDYLEGQGLEVGAAHACTLHQGALWTALSGPAVGGIVDPGSSVLAPVRRHRWLPGFGTCAHPRLVSVALAPLAAVVLAAPAAHAAPTGQPGVISEPGPGQAGITTPTAPETPGPTDTGSPGYADRVEDMVVPAPEQTPEPILPAPQPISEPQSAPQLAPEHHRAPETQVDPEIVPEPQVLTQPDTVSEPQVDSAPQADQAAALVIAAESESVEVAPQSVVYDGGQGAGDAPLPTSAGEAAVGEDRLRFGGVSVPQPEWMTSEAAQWERDWNTVVVLEASDAFAQAGVPDPVADAVLGVDTELVPLPEALEPVVAVIPEPIVHEVEAVGGAPVAELAAVVEPAAAQVVNEVLVHWPPVLG